MSDLSNTAPSPASQPKPPQSAVLIPRPKPVWVVDQRDRLALFFALLVALLTVQVLLYSRYMPGLGMAVLVGVWYALRRWHGGKAAFATKESRLLLAAVLLLTLTFVLFSNVYLRLLNTLLLFCLIVVQLFEGAPGAKAWRTPAMLPRRAYLFLDGLFGRVGSVGAVLASLGKGTRQKRVLAALAGGAVGIGLLCIIFPLLRSADAVFSSLTDQIVHWLQVNLGSAFVRLLLAVLLTPFLFSLLYQLRYPKVDTAVSEHTTSKPTLEPSMPIVLLLLLDAT